jgi:Flp pilus assembly protein TadD
MVKEWRHAAIACLMVVMGAGEANAADGKATQTLTIAADSSQSQADLKEVVDAVLEIRAGRIQQAIDGPLTEVVDRYEKRYAKSRDVVFSARGPVLGLIYLTTSAADHVSRGSGNAIDVGPAWAMAYWGRGYGYSEMNRYPEAEVELKKAIALSPRDAQYVSELAYVYEMQKRFNESLALYLTIPDMVETMDGWPDTAKVEFRCKSYRGQGYNLVELKRYDEAEAAYKACIALIPGEPKSLGELDYIKTMRSKRG